MALHCEVQVWGRICIHIPLALYISCVSWSLLDSGLFFNNMRMSKIRLHKETGGGFTVWKGVPAYHIVGTVLSYLLFRGFHSTFLVALSFFKQFLFMFSVWMSLKLM